MPKCLVCYKWTLDEKDIKIKPEDLSLDVTRAKGKISDFDRNAIEEATLIVEQQGGAVHALTYGTSAVKQSLKDVLSRGPERVYWIADNSAEKADAYVTANVLAAAINKLGPYDLILCGEGSSDSFNQQTAVRLAALLGLPCVSFVLKALGGRRDGEGHAEAGRVHRSRYGKGSGCPQRSGSDQPPAHTGSQAGARRLQEAKPGNQDR